MTRPKRWIQRTVRELEHLLERGDAVGLDDGSRWLYLGNRKWVATGYGREQPLGWLL